MVRRWILLTLVAACSGNAAGVGGGGGSGDGSGTADGGTAMQTDDGLDGTGTVMSCGNGMLDPGEECDDANSIEGDGCLTSCVVPRSCAHVLAERPGLSDGPYRIVPDGEPLDVYCDMHTDGGGWTLVAKVNPTTADTPPRSEPVGWFDMVLAPAQITTATLMLDGPLASIGASRLGPLVAAGALARLELVAADDFDVRVRWYKDVVSAAGFATWFDYGDVPSLVCSDLAMVTDCSMETIAPTGGDNSPTLLGGMDVTDFGYPGGYPIHMRLDDDLSGGGFSGLCSSTENRDGNVWPDSYGEHWGNALLVWVRED